MDLSTIVALWAVPWAVAVAGLVAAARRLGRLESASWLVVVAAFLMVSEDASLAFWLAFADTRMDPQGVAEVVHPHVRGHMFAAAAWTVVAGVLCGWIARTALRRGERWAWWALLVAFLVGGGTDVVVAFTVFSHGLALPTASGRVGGFGWQPIAVFLVAWIAGLVLSYRPIFGRGKRVATQGRAAEAPAELA